MKRINFKTLTVDAPKAEKDQHASTIWCPKRRKAIDVWQYEVELEEENDKEEPMIEEMQIDPNRLALTSKNFLTVYSAILIKVLYMLDSFSLNNFYTMVRKCKLDDLDRELQANYDIVKRLNSWFSGRYPPRPSLPSRELVCLKSHFAYQRELRFRKKLLQSSTYSACICYFCIEKDED